MQRRTILKGLSGALAAVSASLVAIPGGAYVAELVRRRGSSKSLVQRIARVRDLPVGKPALFPVIGTRRDAWTIYPAETIGRVWIVRQSAESTPESEAQVDAFTSVCPHLGCQIQSDARSGRFVCPCHKAVFDRTGASMPEDQLGHRNYAPRGMDGLDCRVVQDEATGDWWVEVRFEEFEQGLTRKVAKA